MFDTEYKNRELLVLQVYTVRETVFPTKLSPFEINIPKRLCHGHI